jgi:Exo-beta-N-acetylmuramidase NamZ, C-terminal
MNDILGNQAVFDAIVRGEDPRRIAEEWREPLGTFERLRQKYLLY